MGEYDTFALSTECNTKMQSEEFSMQCRRCKESSCWNAKHENEQVSDEGEQKNIYIFSLFNLY